MAKHKMKPRLERRTNEYNSLEDVHLAHHFRKPSIFQHLVKMGLVSGNGRIVPEKEWDKNQRKNRNSVKTIKSNSVPSSFIDGNLRPFNKNKNNERNQTSGKNPRRLPFPVFPSRIGITGEPYLLSYILSLQKKKLKRVSPLSRPQSRNKVWDRLCPSPSSGNLSVCSLKRKCNEKTKLKVKYIAKNESSHMVITQQPSGTYNVPIFSGKVSDGDVFEINSCRRTDAPFSLVIYEEGICSRRINTCCEMKLSPGKKIRCLSGHILVMENEGGQPCPKCYFEMSPREVDLKEKFLKMRETEDTERTNGKVFLNKSSSKAVDSDNLEGQDSYTDIFTNDSDSDSDSDSESQKGKETSNSGNKNSSDHSKSTDDSDKCSDSETDEGTHNTNNSGENKSSTSENKSSTSKSTSKSKSTSTSKSTSKSASKTTSESPHSQSSSASSSKSQIPQKETTAKPEEGETVEYSDTTSQSSNIMDDDDDD
ncbi:UNVERIFIED_CONTAM: hypothetical protein RMT77_005387 [Armadillidium vulgare]